MRLKVQILTKESINFFFIMQTWTSTWQRIPLQPNQYCWFLKGFFDSGQKLINISHQSKQNRVTPFLLTYIQAKYPIQELLFSLEIHIKHTFVAIYQNP